MRPGDRLLADFRPAHRVPIAGWAAWGPGRADLLRAVGVLPARLPESIQADLVGGRPCDPDCSVRGGAPSDPRRVRPGYAPMPDRESGGDPGDRCPRLRHFPVGSVRNPGRTVTHGRKTIETLARYFKVEPGLFLARDGGGRLSGTRKTRECAMKLRVSVATMMSLNALVAMDWFLVQEIHEGWWEGGCGSSAAGTFLIVQILVLGPLRCSFVTARCLRSRWALPFSVSWPPPPIAFSGDLPELDARSASSAAIRSAALAKHFCRPPGACAGSPTGSHWNRP